MNRKHEEQSARDAQRLAGAIGGLPRPEVPERLLPQIMARIGPKKPSLSRRSWRWVQRLSRRAAIRGVAIGGVAALAVAMLLWSTGPLMRHASQPPSSFVQGVASESTGWRLAGSDALQAKDVTFVARIPGARHVAVIGSFNDWMPGRHVMHKAPGGDVFTLTVHLPAGRYVYAFLVDGTILKPDSSALLQEDDGFGHTNSVLIIEDDNSRQQAGGRHVRPL
ncbi:glycoside hydrolase family 13 [Desulfovibrio sp. JY]|nr:glycoside hydrolase family 13 [Desulfovibrio sp. JY]